MTAPAIGDKLPDFTLPLATREGKTTFRLSEALGETDLVIAFYPLAFTGVCTQQVCDLRDTLQDLAALNVRVVGASTDTVYANVQFARAQGLPFGLLSDANRDVLPGFWELQEVVGVRDCVKRGVLVLDREGVVKWRWITNDPDEWVGVDAIRERLASDPPSLSARDFATY